MIYVIYVFSGLFLILGVGMVYVYFREKHIGLFLMGVAYGTAALLAINLKEWWPLVIGFVLVWMLRLLGLEPPSKRKSEGGEGKAEEGQSSSNS